MSRKLARITLADFLVRSAYQMGKTPLLPLFAASLGATDALLGLIVSVSTLTGMVCKPLVGLLSDRWGRRVWLIIGTAFFATVPFFYRFVHTPEQLVAIRVVHGLATAIYGPVTVAFVAEQNPQRRGQQLGVFGLARGGGYIVGPAVAGWLLLYLDAQTIFVIIGLISLVAFVPIWRLGAGDAPRGDQPPLAQQLRQALRAVRGASAVWLAGALDAIMYMATYAVKAFLPLYALSLGANTAVIGSFFAVQEAVHLLLRPVGGRIGDKSGHRTAVIAGMIVLGTAVGLVAQATSVAAFFAAAAVIGAAQALILPSVAALVADQVADAHLGAGMGAVGTLDNAGKVAGPLIAGALLTQFEFALAFGLLGGVLWVTALALWLAAPPRTRSLPMASGLD